MNDEAGGEVGDARAPFELATVEKEVYFGGVGQQSRFDSPYLLTPMFKTLFLLPVMAVCASAADLEKAVIDLSGCMDGDEISLSAHSVTININSSPVLGYLHGSTEKATSMTLNFSDNNTLQCAESFAWTAPALHFTITADADTQDAWARELLSSHKGGSVTLIGAGVSFSLTAPDGIDAVLLGQGTVGGSVTLGSHTAQYMGFFTSAAEAQKSITAAGQIALVGSSEDGALTLVGRLNRATPAVPEPATASLSLLALAALASRRRR